MTEPTASNATLQDLPYTKLRDTVAELELAYSSFEAKRTALQEARDNYKQQKSAREHALVLKHPGQDTPDVEVIDCKKKINEITDALETLAEYGANVRAMREAARAEIQTRNLSLDHQTRLHLQEQYRDKWPKCKAKAIEAIIESIFALQVGVHTADPDGVDLIAFVQNALGPELLAAFIDACADKRAQARETILSTNDRLGA